jgi:hypothetical protein
MPGEIRDEEAKFVLEAWKTVIGVQQHFNTIEMQIRSIAITVLTAVVGAAVVIYGQTQKAASDAAQTGFHLPTASLLALGGLFAWGAFYFMDRWWYHRLLEGAVKHGQAIEDKIRELPPFGEVLGLSTAIRRESAIGFLRKHEIHSARKIDLFYVVVAVLLVVLIIAFW